MSGKQITNLLGILLLINLIGIFFDGSGFPKLRFYTDIFFVLVLLPLFSFWSNGRMALAIKVILIYFSLIGIIFSNENFIKVFFSDLGTFCMMISVLLLRYIDLRKFSKIFYILVLIVIIYYFNSFQYIDTSLIQSGQTFKRGDAFSALSETTGDFSGLFIYKLQTLLNPILYLYLFLLPVSYNYINRNAVNVLAISCFFIIFFYSLYYQKRQNFVELSFILITLFTTYSKFLPILTRSRYSKFLSTTIGIIFIYYFFNSPYLINILDRFNNELDSGVGDFSRLREFTNVSEDFTLFNYIFGMGLGSFTSKAYSAGANLHIGYFNFVYKGGIILLLLVVSMLIKNLLFFYNRLQVNPLYPIGFSITLFSIVSLSIAPGYGIYPSTFFIGIALFSRFVVSNFKI